MYEKLPAAGSCLLPGSLIGFHNTVTGHFLRDFVLCLKLLQAHTSLSVP